jgi:exopolysaccharide production protein ExoQ
VKSVRAGSLQVSAAPGNAEKAFVVFVLLLLLGAFQNLSVTGPIEDLNMGSFAMQLLWSLIYLVTLALYFRSCARPLRTILSVFPLIAVVSFAAISFFWSQDPQLSLRRSIALSLTLVFGVYLASRFEIREHFRLLAWTFSVCIVSSFLFELLGLNPTQEYAGWYGIFDHKNSLGRNMVLGSLVFLFWKKVEPEHRQLAIAGLLASAALILLSRDTTSFVVLPLMLIILPYLQWTLRRSACWAAGGIALLLASGAISVFYLFTHIEWVAGLLGKDPMLTGRLPLWIVSVVMAVRRPWLGYGYSAFWLPDQGYTQRIWHLMGWVIPHAHNGLLELWLELGLVGTALFLVVFAYYVVRASGLVRRNSEPAAAWPLIFLMFLFFENLTESALLSENSIYFVLYATLAAGLYSKGTERSVFTNLALRR